MKTSNEGGLIISVVSFFKLLKSRKTAPLENQRVRELARRVQTEGPKTDIAYLNCIIFVVNLPDQTRKGADILKNAIPTLCKTFTRKPLRTYSLCTRNHHAVLHTTGITPKSNENEFN